MKPWEEYAKMKKEGKGPWEEYQDTKMAQMEQDREYFDTARETVEDMAITGAQGATLDFMDEMAGAAGQMTGGDYVTSRDAMRAKVQGARDRSPIMTPIAEAAGSIATSAAIPALRGGTVAKELGLAVIQGAGNAPEMEDIPKSAAISSGASLVSQGAMGLAKKAIKNPNDIRANAMGARGINYRKGEPFIGDVPVEDFDMADRLKDPAGLAARLKKIGFYNMGERNMDVLKGQYVRSGSGLEGSMKAVDLESMMGRVQQGVSQLRERNIELLKGKKIPLRKIGDILTDAAHELIPEGEDIAKRSKTVTELVQTMVDDLQRRGHIRGNYIEAKDIETIKRNWQKTVASTYDGNKALSEITNVGVEARRKMATRLDELVDSYGGPDYKRNNDIMRDLLTAEVLIHDKASAQRAYHMGGKRLTMGGKMGHIYNTVAEDTIAHPQADMIRANMGDFNKSPNGQLLESFFERIPVRGISDGTQDQQGPMRRPQSVPNIPEELIRTPLPRTTQGLMQNKNFVLAKVAQMMPDMFEAVKDTYEREPERLGELAQVIAMRMPHVFERDKYNRFDGRILSDQDKNRAIKDTLTNPKLNAIQQADIITRLNKEGLYDG
jgi:hypothetical protein